MTRIPTAKWRVDLWPWLQESSATKTYFSVFVSDTACRSIYESKNENDQHSTGREMTQLFWFERRACSSSRYWVRYFQVQKSLSSEKSHWNGKKIWRCIQSFWTERFVFVLCRHLSVLKKRPKIKKNSSMELTVIWTVRKCILFWPNWSFAFCLSSLKCPTLSFVWKCFKCSD